MPEYAHKTGTGTTRSESVRGRTPATTQLQSLPRVEPQESGAARHPLQAALNHAPAVQAVARLKRTLNQAGRVAPVTQLVPALRETPAEVAQGKFVTAQRVEEEEPLQGRFATAQRVEEEEPLQGKFATAQRVEEEEPLQGKFATAQRVASAVPNRTGLPDDLKQGVESLSGMDLSDVRVHQNSDSPARLNALAYAQGDDIHLGRGEERHLPHEAWHVVQQRQGRVSPTMDVGGVPVNDDHGLEAEADRMGGQASQMKRDGTLESTYPSTHLR